MYRYRIVCTMTDGTEEKSKPLPGAEAKAKFDQLKKSSYAQREYKRIDLVEVDEPWLPTIETHVYRSAVWSTY